MQEQINLAESSFVSNQPPLPYKEYKSLIQMWLIAINVAVSSFWFGYAVIYLATVQFTAITDYYHIQSANEGNYEGILTGIVQASGAFGALAAFPMIKVLSRRNNFLIANLISFISIGIIMIPNLPSLLVGRIIQGIPIGIYSSIVPLYINEIVPTSLKQLGTLTQITMAFGSGFAFLLQYLLAFGLSPVDQYIVLCLFPLLLLIPQSIIFLFIFTYETPNYYFSNKLYKEGVELMEKLYSQEYIADYKSKNKKLEDLIKLQENNEIEKEEDLSEQIKSESIIQHKDTWKAIIAVLHIGFYQQMIGISAIGTFGGNIFAQLLPNLQAIMMFIFNILTGLPSITTTHILKIFGRKTMLIAGGFITTAVLGLCFVGDIIQATHYKLGQILVLVGLLLFATNYGFTVGPVTWLYIPEIVSPKWIPAAIFMNWFGAAINIIFFPIILMNYCNNDPKYLYLFWIIYSLIGTILFYFLLIQTKGKTFHQVQLEFEQNSSICNFRPKQKEEDQYFGQPQVKRSKRASQLSRIPGQRIDNASDLREVLSSN